MINRSCVYPKQLMPIKRSHSIKGITKEKDAPI